MNPETKNEVLPGLKMMERERLREGRWTAFCWLSGIVPMGLFLLVIHLRHPFMPTGTFMSLVFMSPFLAAIIGIAVWGITPIVREWPSDSAHALARRLRDDQYQCRRLTRLLVALTYHAPIPAGEIEAAWQALTYARDLRNGSHHYRTYEDSCRIRRAEAMYRVWRADYDQQAPERAIAEAQAEMERAIMKVNWHAQQD